MHKFERRERSVFKFERRERSVYISLRERYVSVYEFERKGGR